MNQVDPVLREARAREVRHDVVATLIGGTHLTFRGVFAAQWVIASALAWKSSLPGEPRLMFTMILGAMLSVPIMWTSPRGGAEPLGVVNLSDRRSSQPFSAGDQKLISAIATQLGTAIQNAGRRVPPRRSRRPESGGPEDSSRARQFRRCRVGQRRMAGDRRYDRRR